MAALPSGYIFKSLAGLSCCPHHQVGLLEVQTGAGMDEESDRKVAQGRKDALAHFALLPGHHSILLWGELKKISFSDSALSLQAYVLNLPIGHKISNVARDAVKLGDYKWKLNEHNRKRWKTWVSQSSWCAFQNLIWLPFLQLKRAFPGALIMVTIGFLAAYLIEKSGGDQFWMDFVMSVTPFSCVF